MEEKRADDERGRWKRRKAADEEGEEKGRASGKQRRSLCDEDEDIQEDELRVL